MFTKTLQPALLATLILIAFLQLGCAPPSADPHWKFQRQVTDAQGLPLSNTSVHINAYRNPHVWNRGEINYDIVTDTNGTFAVDVRRETVHLTITKPGFITKEFSLYPQAIPPDIFPPSGKIVLARSQPLPPLDDLDQQEFDGINVSFAKAVKIGISFLPPGAPGSQPLVYIEPGTNCYIITCVEGVTAQVLPWEPGIREGWKESNAIISETNQVTSFVVSYHPRCHDIAASFVLKAPDYWVRVALAPTDDTFCSLYFDLSRDNIFVRP